MDRTEFIKSENEKMNFPEIKIAQSAGAVEYTDCTSAEE